MSKFLTDAHAAAAMLDPRTKEFWSPDSPNVMAAASFQQAKPRACAYLQKFYHNQPLQQQMVLRDFARYQGTAADNNFNLAAITPESTKQQVREWWLSGQPSSVLGKVAVFLLAVRPSQGTAERAWATLTRQASPIRNALLGSTKAKLLRIFYNHTVLQANGSLRALQCKGEKKVYGIVPGLNSAALDAVYEDIEEQHVQYEQQQDDDCSSSSSLCLSLPEHDDNIDDVMEEVPDVSEEVDLEQAVDDMMLAELGRM
jgi:hypothetical protein